MHRSSRYALLTACILITLLSCQTVNRVVNLPTDTPTETHTPAPTSTPLQPVPVKPGDENPDEPVLITGDIPYTSPFFVDSLGEPFILLEDQTGFIRRDRTFVFPLASQAIGPVTVHPDQSLTYQLPLPSVPQGTQVDVDNDGEQDLGVQVFAVAYWSNTWGDPFLEERDGVGWSSAHASTIVDVLQENEIVGGTLIVWAPDDTQDFPSGFGADGLLFTPDDPTAPIPPGYNLIDLSEEPFRFYKEAQPEIDLVEGIGEINDYSSQTYAQAFDSLYEKVSREYPFTVEKDLDWEAIYDEFQPAIAYASNSAEFFRALKNFASSIPDGHIQLSFDPAYFYDRYGGGLGLILEELSDGRLIVTEVFPDTSGSRAGIAAGAELLEWNGGSVQQAISVVNPYSEPFSTEHTRRINQVRFLTRLPPGTEVEITYKNPDQTEPQTTSLEATEEFASLSPIIGQTDPIALPIEGEVLDDSGLGYVRINSFSGDYRMLASLWEHYIQGLLDNQIPGLIIDLRENTGGYTGLAYNLAGYFFEEEHILYYNSLYDERQGEFVRDEKPSKVKPAPLFYGGPIIVLVSSDCISACEGFAYALQETGRAQVIGHHPSAGAFGSVGLGQFALPDGISMQFPMGRPEKPDGEVLIEGVGIVPDITVPVTYESALQEEDTILQAAIQALFVALR